MNKIDVSVIVPFYNCQAYLSKCIDSILDQKNLFFELILINDGSTDGSELIATDYAKADKRIVLYNQSNKGIPESRNKGLELAKGTYFLFIDADDYIAPNSLHLLTKIALENNVDILQSSIYRIFGNDTPQKWSIHPVSHPIKGNDYFNLMAEKRSLRTNPYQNLVKRSYSESLSFRFDESLKRMQDFEYYTKLIILAKSVMNIDFPYYYYQVDTNTDVRPERLNTTSSFFYYKHIDHKFDLFVKEYHLNQRIQHKLKWYISTHASNYSSVGLIQLPKTEISFWRKYIQKYLFKNRGWMRPYAYQRYLRYLFIEKWWK